MIGSTGTLLETAISESLPYHTAAERRLACLARLRQRTFFSLNDKPTRWMDRLAAFLNSDQHRLCVISGCAGAGKSVIAYQLEERLLERSQGYFPIYIDVEELDPHNPRCLDGRVSRLQATERPGIDDHRPFLFVLDGCESWECLSLVASGGLLHWPTAKCILLSRTPLPDDASLVFPDATGLPRRGLVVHWPITPWKSNRKHQYFREIKWKRLEICLSLAGLLATPWTSFPRALSNMREHLLADVDQLWLNRIPCGEDIAAALLRRCLDAEQYRLARLGTIRCLSPRRTSLEQISEPILAEAWNNWKQRDCQALPMFRPGRTSSVNPFCHHENPLFSADTGLVVLGFSNPANRLYLLGEGEVEGEWGSTRCLAVNGQKRVVAIGGSEHLITWQNGALVQPCITVKASALAIVPSGDQLALSVDRSRTVSIYSLSNMEKNGEIKFSSTPTELQFWQTYTLPLLVGRTRKTLEFGTPTAKKSEEARRLEGVSSVRLALSGEVVTFIKDDIVSVGSFWTDLHDQRLSLAVQPILSPTNRLLAIIDSNRVLVRDLANGSETSITKDASTPIRIAWSAHKDLAILWQDQNGNYCFVEHQEEVRQDD